MSRFTIVASAALILAMTVPCPAADWADWRGEGRQGVWSEKGLMGAFPSRQLKPLWTAEISSGYSGPTVAEGRVYVTDRQVDPEETERIHCFDAATGKKEWTHTYPARYGRIGYKAGPRASVIVAAGRAYALGAAGHLHCLDAKKGSVVWTRDLNADYDIRMPIWGIAGAPLLVEDVLIVHIGGSNGACVVGLDAATGNEKWRALSDRAQYTAPILIEQGGKKIVVVWTGDSVAGLDPASGKVYWRHNFQPTRMPIGIATPVTDGKRLFLTSFYDGSMMLRLAQDKPAAEITWRERGRDERNTRALHSIISTPLLIGDYIYGVDSYGELRCLKADTGERVWESLKATPRARWSTIHMVTQGDRVWMFNERGELIISKLSPMGYEEISRTKLIEPTTEQLRQRDGVC